MSAESAAPDEEAPRGCLPDHLDAHFPRYESFDPLVPVWCVTPHQGRVIHRFFDTSPFSPSGRYLALTRLPAEGRSPRPGDVAEVVVVDMHTGTSTVVAETRGWDTQLGAQAQWGADDRQLFFNDLDTPGWRPYGVRLDPATGKRRRLEGSVYMLSPDGRWAASPCLLRIRAIQPGYGVVAPRDAIPANRGAATDDGIYLTDTRTGRSRLLVSLAEIAERAGPTGLAPASGDGDLYGFHVKWAPDGRRLQFVVCALPRERGSGRRVLRQLITLAADGSDIRVAIPARQWAKGGHHPNWCPDGEHVMMNLRLDGAGMRLVRARYDGTELTEMVADIPGSGHPSLHPDGRHVLTDAYPTELAGPADARVPIRLIDLQAGRERTLVRINCLPPYSGAARELRVDAHPAWSRDFRRIAFNGCPDGTRRVYVADLSGELG